MPRHRRALITLAALTGTVAVLGLVRMGAVLAATVNVTVADNVFQPASAAAAQGDTVVWTQPGARVHTVTADDGSFDSGNLVAGQTFSRTFDAPGTYRYYCKIHGAPGGSGMSGVIVVQAAQATTTSTTAATTTTTAAQATTTTVAPTATTAATTATTAAPTVAGTSVARQAEPETLARTGMSIGMLAAFGLTLVFTGFVFVSDGERRRTGPGNGAETAPLSGPVRSGRG